MNGPGFTRDQIPPVDDEPAKPILPEWGHAFDAIVVTILLAILFVILTHI